MTFALDGSDREAIGWVASPTGYSGDDILNLMLESVEKRFGDQLPNTPVQWLGAKIEVNLLQRGFAPAVGGEIEVRVWPSVLEPLHLESRGDHMSTRAQALVSAMPISVASHELDRVATRLKLDRRAMQIVETADGTRSGAAYRVRACAVDRSI